VSPTITIGGRRIQDGHPCFIIAEAGSNHDGKLDQALQLIDAAAEAGADAVKFQLFRAARLYPKSSGRSEYLNNPRSIYDIMAEMEMPYDWLPHLAARCRTGGVLFLGSVFDEESVDRLDPYVEAFKIASYEMTHLPLVRYVARKGKPVILSTGTADLDEVAETVDEFRRTGNERLVLMQCTAAYPAPLESPRSSRPSVCRRDSPTIPETRWSVRWRRSRPARMSSKSTTRSATGSPARIIASR